MSGLLSRSFYYFAIIVCRQFKSILPFNLALDFEVAPLHKRILAYLIDIVILVIYSWGMRKFLYDVLEVPVNAMWGINVGTDVVFVSIPMSPLHPFICELSMHGQSFGKN